MKLLLGMVAAAAAFYFLKTEKGRETAENLLGSFNDLSSNLRDRASDSYAEVTEQAKNVIDNLRTKTSQY